MALGAFVVALVHFEDDYLEACDVTAESGTGYVATVGDTDGRSGVVQVTIGQNGRPVDGATVCVRVQRTDKPYVVASGRGRQAAAPGTYDLSLRFSGPGRWSGSVVIFRGEARPVAVPVSFTLTSSVEPS